MSQAVLRDILIALPADTFDHYGGCPWLDFSANCSGSASCPTICVRRSSRRASCFSRSAAQSGTVKGTLSESGLLLEIADLAQVDPQFSGTLSLTYKAQVPPDVLSRV